MHTLASLRAGELAGNQRLDLSCGMTEFPHEIFDLADTLEILNLSGNRLADQPDDLPRLHKLRVIFCSDNLFTRVPEVLGRCDATPEAASTLAAMRALQRRCDSTAASERPLFSEIRTRLAELAA